jgi:hypothetical protein
MPACKYALVLLELELMWALTGLSLSVEVFRPFGLFVSTTPLHLVVGGSTENPVHFGFLYMGCNIVPVASHVM